MTASHGVKRQFPIQCIPTSWQRIYDHIGEEKMPHRVLDLDLDFFLDEIETWKSSSGSRLQEDDFHAWGEDQVRAFLENQCGLSRENPIPGCLVTHHDEAFVWWRNLVLGGLLKPPFEIVHIDAHSDMGFGDNSVSYIMGELLYRPVESRMNPKTGPGGLHAGSYVSFAAACRWLGRVEYVLHPKANDDFVPFHFKNNDPYSGALQLKKCDSESLRGHLNAMYGPRSFEAEPDIPYEMVMGTKFKNVRPFTLGLLCQSPGFTPASSDALIPVIMEYIKPLED
jgi:hypothetical protein